jgi:hypothetical protein
VPISSSYTTPSHLRAAPHAHTQRRLRQRLVTASAGRRRRRRRLPRRHGHGRALLRERRLRGKRHGVGGVGPARVALATGGHMSDSAATDLKNPKQLGLGFNKINQQLLVSILDVIRLPSFGLKQGSPTV